MFEAKIEYKICHLEILRKKNKQKITLLYIHTYCYAERPNIVHMIRIKQKPQLFISNQQ